MEGDPGRMTAFDEATAVSRRSEMEAAAGDLTASTGTWLYDAAADPRFALVAPGGATPPAVNGGALLATVLRAVLDCSPHPHPVATSANFLRVPQLARRRSTGLVNGRRSPPLRSASISATGRARWPPTALPAFPLRSRCCLI